MRKEWKRRNGLQPSGVKRPGRDDLDRRLEKRAKTVLDQVEPGFERLKTAMLKAEEDMIKKLDEEAEKEPKAAPNASTEAASLPDTKTVKQPIDSASELAAIECQEELPPLPAKIEQPISDVAKRELTILAAQDAAMVSELARIFREKALELAKERMRRSGVKID
jgi:methionine aminopeptidase